MSVIYGKRVRLRAIESDDVPRCYEWVNDPEVTRGLTLFLPMSMREERDWYEGLAKRPPEERPLAVEIKDGDGWKHIGNCGTFGFNWTARLAEMGIMIGDKAEWGKGYGTETMELLLRHGFETLNLNRIELRVYADNPRAIRAYQKCGFVEEGRQREAHYKNGKYDDVIIMSVLRSEWQVRSKENQS